MRTAYESTHENYYRLVMYFFANTLQTVYGDTYSNVYFGNLRVLVRWREDIVVRTTRKSNRSHII